MLLLLLLLSACLHCTIYKALRFYVFLSLLFWCVFVVNPAIFKDFNNIYFLRICSMPCIVLVYRFLMAVMVDFTELFSF
nr:MAG TPA: hypothetical protein [Caudoviricetes sp.]